MGHPYNTCPSAPIDEQQPAGAQTQRTLPPTDPHLREPLVGVGLAVERQRVLRDVVVQEEVQLPVGFGEVVERRLQGLPARQGEAGGCIRVPCCDPSNS